MRWGQEAVRVLSDTEKVLHTQWLLSVDSGQTLPRITYYGDCGPVRPFQCRVKPGSCLLSPPNVAPSSRHTSLPAVGTVGRNPGHCELGAQTDEGRKRKKIKSERGKNSFQILINRGSVFGFCLT